MKKQTKRHQEETNRQTKVRYSAENLTLSLTETKKKKWVAILEITTKYKV